MHGASDERVPSAPADARTRLCVSTDDGFSRHICNMKGRSSTGSAAKSRSILDYFKPQSAVAPQQKPAKTKIQQTGASSSAVIDVSSGEDDNDHGDDGLQVLTEIRSNPSTERSGGKVIRKSAPGRIGIRTPIPTPDHKATDLSIISSDIICSEIRTKSRDSGSVISDEDDEMESSVVPEEGMELDMSEFLDVLVDESAAGSEQENQLRQSVISSSAASDEAVTSSENDYKFTNFRHMIDFVLNDASHSHLLNAEDWSVIENVTSLPVPAQRLFVRLLLRKHNWIRSSHINYPEVADPGSQQQLLKDLVHRKLLIHCSTIPSLEEALSLLDVKELKSCAASLGTRGVGSGPVNLLHTKQHLIDSIIKHAKSNQSIKSHFSSSRKFTVSEVALNQVKKILGDTAYYVADDVSCLISRLTYLYYPPQVNEDENGVAISHEFFNQLKVTQGILKYPEYEIYKKTIVFRTRDDLVRYEAACRLESLVLAAVARKDHEIISNKYFLEAEKEFNRIFSSGDYQLDQSLPVFLRNQTAGHVYTRCLSHMVQSFEQSKQHERAVHVLRNLIDQDTYCLSYKGKWYERLVIDLEKHLKQPQDAFSTLSRSMRDEAVVLSFKYNLYVRGKKAAKSGKKFKFPAIEEFYQMEKCKEKMIVSATLSKSIQGRKTIFIANASAASEAAAGEESMCLPVENVAMNHYLQEEGFTRGLHSESLVYHALFNIMLWDQIYLPVEDAFRTEHQSLPLDFVHEDFYRRRKEFLDKRMDQIRRMHDCHVAAEIDRIWAEKNGTQCLIKWQEVQLQDLKELSFCLGVDVMAAIFERLYSNFRFNRSGLPDLILWNAEEKRVKVVEVKGPGDSLSGKQILWLDYFKSCGLPAEVCYVKAARNC